MHADKAERERRAAGEAPAKFHEVAAEHQRRGESVFVGQQRSTVGFDEHVIYYLAGLRAVVPVQVVLEDVAEAIVLEDITRKCERREIAAEAVDTQDDICLTAGRKVAGAQINRSECRFARIGPTDARSLHDFDTVEERLRSIRTVPAPRGAGADAMAIDLDARFVGAAADHETRVGNAI